MHPQMKKYVFLMMVVGCLMACGHGRQQEVERFRMKIRSQFLEEKLAKAKEDLARTDSIMQQRNGEVDSTPGYMDSLELAADIQGAQIRYIHKKQKDIQ